MTLVSAMQHCYGVVPEAFGRCFASSQADASSDDSGGEDAALGVPRDQTMEEASQKEATEGCVFFTGSGVLLFDNALGRCDLLCHDCSLLLVQAGDVALRAC